MDTWVGRRRILKSKSEATTEQMKWVVLRVRSLSMIINSTTSSAKHSHFGAKNNPASKTALARVPPMASKMALTPSTVLSSFPKMMVMLSGWLSRVCVQEEQEALGCQQERLTLAIGFKEELVFVINRRASCARMWRWCCKRSSFVTFH